MSSKVTITQSKGVRVIGLITIILGALMMLVGAGAYWQVSSQLSAEHITVSKDADFLAGKRVMGPFTAYAQAEVINKHALAEADGKTYAELERDDPARATMMNASFLRASLFTSVVAFGLAAFAAAVGLIAILLGWSLRRISVGPAVVVENFDSPAPRHAAPAKEEAEEVPARVVDETPPSARVARRAAVATDTAEEPDATGRPSGTDVAETLRRHSRASETAVIAPVVVPDQVVDPAEEALAEVAPVTTPAVPVVPAIPETAAPAVSHTPALSFDDAVVNDPPASAAPEVPVPPRQSWQSPADRAPVGDDQTGSQESGATET